MPVYSPDYENTYLVNAYLQIFDENDQLVRRNEVHNMPFIIQQIHGFLQFDKSRCEARAHAVEQSATQLKKIRESEESDEEKKKQYGAEFVKWRDWILPDLRRMKCHWFKEAEVSGLVELHREKNGPDPLDRVQRLEDDIKRLMPECRNLFKAVQEHPEYIKALYDHEDIVKKLAAKK